jgi:hypothetical protein
VRFSDVIQYLSYYFPLLLLSPSLMVAVYFFILVVLWCGRGRGWMLCHCEDGKVQVMLRLTVSQSVSQSVSMSWCQAHYGTYDQILFSV